MRTQLQVPGTGLTLLAEWEGGPYIDLRVNYWSNEVFDVVNVWDYSKGESSYPFTRQGLRSAVRYWLADYGTEDLLRDLRAGDIIR